MRWMSVMMVVLLGCEIEGESFDALADEASLPMDQAATPTPPFVAGAMQAGQPAQLSWFGVPPGATVTFGVSLTGDAGGPCPPSLGVLCLDIEPALYLLGTATADATGTAALALASVPAGLADGTPLYFQAVYTTSGGVSRPGKSNVYQRDAGLTVCTRQYDPVCGANGVTYGNHCMAEAAGWASAFEGVCP